MRRWSLALLLIAGAAMLACAASAIRQAQLDEWTLWKQNEAVLSEIRPIDLKALFESEAYRPLLEREPALPDLLGRKNYYLRDDCLLALNKAKFPRNDLVAPTLIAAVREISKTPDVSVNGVVVSGLVTFSPALFANVAVLRDYSREKAREVQNRFSISNW